MSKVKENNDVIVDKKALENLSNTTPQVKKSEKLQKRKLSQDSISKDFKKQKFAKNDIDHKEQKLLGYLDTLEKTSMLNNSFTSILTSASQGAEGIVLGGALIKECKKNNIWNPENIICTMLEESIENNVEMAKKTVALSTLTDNLLKSEATMDKASVIDNGINNIVLSILGNGGVTDEKQKMLVQLEISNIKDLQERLTNNIPIRADLIPAHVEFIDNLCNLSKVHIDIKNTLKPHFLEFINERDELQEILSKHSVRILGHANEIKNISKLQLTEIALKIDLAINKLKEHCSEMSIEQLQKFNEIEKNWNAKKMELTNANKLKDMSKNNEHKPEKSKDFWKSINIKLDVTQRFKHNKQEVEQRLKDNKMLKDEFNKVSQSAEQLNIKVNQLKTKNTLEGVSTDIKNRNDTLKVSNVNVEKNKITPDKIIKTNLIKD